MTTILHKDRYSTTSTIVKRGVVIHDSESPDSSTAGLVAALQRPGDRDNGHGGKYGSGYHAVTDGLGGYVVMGDATAGPYAAPPLNGTWWHVCMPGYAKQLAAGEGDTWSDELSTAHIHGVARFIADKWVADGKTWPLLFRTSFDLAKGLVGFTAHAEVSKAWHKTDHTDPGPNFPWAVLLEAIDDLTTIKPTIPVEPTEPPEEEMSDAITTTVYYVDGKWPDGSDGGIWFEEAGVLKHLTGEEWAQFQLIRTKSNRPWRTVQTTVGEFADYSTIYA